ncbi:MAG: hypothetical protein ACYTAN_13995 [Planctomycetota bacterium]|jgi:hypothetical protein
MVTGSRPERTIPLPLVREAVKRPSSDKIAIGAFGATVEGAVDSPGWLGK